MAQIKFIDFDVWSSNQQWLHDYIDLGDSKAIKSASLSPDGKKLRLYKVTTPTEATVPDFELEFPDIGDTTLDGFIRKINSGTENNVVLVAADGSVKDSGIAIDDIAQVSYVDEQIARAKTETDHLTKKIVETLPAVADAKENVIYMKLVDTVTGDDKYEEYMLIGNALVMIGTTSTDLSDYYTKTETEGKISTAKQEAISAAAADATSKANQALSDANLYTDTSVGTVNTAVTNLTTRVTTAEGDITTINNTLTAHGDRLTALEESVGDIQVASEEEALAVFNSIFES